MRRNSVLWDIFILHLYCFGFTNFSRCLFLLQFCTVVTCNKKRHLKKFVKHMKMSQRPESTSCNKKRHLKSSKEPSEIRCILYLEIGADDRTKWASWSNTLNIRHLVPIQWIGRKKCILSCKFWIKNFKVEGWKSKWSRQILV